MDLNRVLIRPLISEKTMSNATLGRYTFEIDLKSTKNDIKKAIEKQFGVNVVKVQTLTFKGKARNIGKKHQRVKGKEWKKAVVQVKKEQKIDLFEIATQ